MAFLAASPMSMYSRKLEQMPISLAAKSPPSTTYNFATLTADAAFQLDLFGELRPATEAARAQLLATEDTRQTVILTLVSDVAVDYFVLLELDLELQITYKTIEAQQSSVKLTNFRVEHGVATKLDVLQAQQTLDVANATSPISREKSHEQKMPSASSSAITRTRGHPLPFLRKFPQGFLRRSSNVGPIFARRSRT
jgi:outer membrane protein TolC